MPKSRPIEIIARGLWPHQGRVLLCQNVAKGYFYLPGGHVEHGESAAHALRREFAEETGRRVAIGRLRMIAEAAFTRKGATIHEINLVFHVEPPAGTRPVRVRSREDDIAFAWVPIAELATIDLRPACIARALPELLEGEGVVHVADISPTRRR